MDEPKHRPPVGERAHVLAMWRGDGVTYHLAQSYPLGPVMIVAVNGDETVRIASCTLAPYELWAWLLLSDEARTEAAEIFLNYGVVKGQHNGH